MELIFLKLDGTTTDFKAAITSSMGFGFTKILLVATEDEKVMLFGPVESDVYSFSYKHREMLEAYQRHNPTAKQMGGGESGIGLKYLAVNRSQGSSEFGDIDLSEDGWSEIITDLTSIGVRVFRD